MLFTTHLKKGVKSVTDKVIALLGFAAKAGALRFGFAASTQAVKCKKAKAVFFAEDISEKSRKEIFYFCNKYGTDAVGLTGIDIKTLGVAVGRNCGVVALTDENFKTPILNNLTSDICFEV